MMKQLISIITVAVLFSINSSRAINFEKTGTWSEILQKAKKENKIVFVDAYAKWCGPCKAMDANVFPNIELSKMFDENFINYKIDMESQAGEIFEEKYSVEAFPTLFFISPNGTVLKKVVGAMSVEKLIDIGNLVLSPESSILITLEKQFAKGDRSVDFLKSYVEELNKVNENNTEVSTALLLALGVDKIAEDEKMFVIFYQTQFSIES